MLVYLWRSNHGYAERNGSVVMNVKEQELFAEYPDLLTTDDLKKMLCIGRNAAYELVWSGAVASIRVGRSYRIIKQSVIDYINCSKSSHRVKK
jgi:hypothetical protein